MSISQTNPAHSDTARLETRIDDSVVDSSRIEATSEKIWPLKESPISDNEIPLWNFYYLGTCEAPRDPTIVWGTDVECDRLKSHLRRLNETSDVLVTPAHALLAATGRALCEHPQFNRRILRRRVYEYRNVNMLMPLRVGGEPGDVMLLEQVDTKSMTEIATELWNYSHTVARGEDVVEQASYMKFPRWVLARLLPLHVLLVNRHNSALRNSNRRQRSAATLVNYLGFRGAAPIRSFKPSRLPYDSVTLSVTMGAAEPRPVAVNGSVEVRNVAPLIIRGDHRLVDAYEIGVFAETLRSLLANPERIDAR